ncbi:MAG: hypothetical protein H7A37_06065 [Chlamydiales bacterium]|nr:hypothetical protein [Chlamydiales bacterium]
MLKLEKTKKHRDVAVRIRKRDRFLTRGFLISLAVTLLLHVSAAYIFHISLFNLPGSENPLPPITVTTAADDSDAIHVAGSNERLQANTFGLEPQRSPLVLPSALPEKNADSLLSAATSYRFSSFLPPELPRPDPIMLTVPSAEVTFYGPLADLPITSDGTENFEEIATTAPVRYERLTFEVQMDPGSGTFFWVRPLSRTTSRYREQLAQQILKKVRFKKNAFPAITTGYAEVTIPIT